MISGFVRRFARAYLAAVVRAPLFHNVDGENRSPSLGIDIQLMMLFSWRGRSEQIPCGAGVCRIVRRLRTRTEDSVRSRIGILFVRAIGERSLVRKVSPPAGDSLRWISAHGVAASHNYIGSTVHRRPSENGRLWTVALKCRKGRPSCRFYSKPCMALCDHYCIKCASAGAHSPANQAVFLRQGGVGKGGSRIPFFKNSIGRAVESSGAIFKKTR